MSLRDRMSLGSRWEDERQRGMPSALREILERGNELNRTDSLMHPGPWGAPPAQRSDDPYTFCIRNDLYSAEGKMDFISALQEFEAFLYNQYEGRPMPTGSSEDPECYEQNVYVGEHNVLHVRSCNETVANVIAHAFRDIANRFAAGEGRPYMGGYDTPPVVDYMPRMFSDCMNPWGAPSPWNYGYDPVRPEDVSGIDDLMRMPGVDAVSYLERMRDERRRMEVHRVEEVRPGLLNIDPSKVSELSAGE